MTGEEKPDKSSPTTPVGNPAKGLSGRDWRARRDALGAALEKRRVENEVQEKKRNTNNMAGLGAALRLTSEFIAGIVVGSLVGWLIDEVAGTSPFALIVFFLLGFCAGVLNVMRSAGLVAEQGSEVKNPVAGGGNEKLDERTGKEG